MPLPTHYDAVQPAHQAAGWSCRRNIGRLKGEQYRRAKVRSLWFGSGRRLSPARPCSPHLDSVMTGAASVVDACTEPCEHGERSETRSRRRGSLIVVRLGPTLESRSALLTTPRLRDGWCCLSG